MSTNHAALLVEQGEFRRAGEWLGAKKELSITDRVLLAHIELECGRAETAFSQARALLSQRLDSRVMTLFTRDSLERMGVTTRSVPSERRPRVKLHRNAKTTPHMRALLVHRVQMLHWPVTAAATAAGIAARTAYKWLARYRRAAAAAGGSRRRTPHRSRGARRPAGGERDGRRAPRAPDGLGDRGPAADPAVDGGRHPRAGRPQSAARRSRRRRRSPAMSGRGRGSSCISISNRSSASSGPAIACTATGGRG